jgi:hypothetical protein
MIRDYCKNQMLDRMTKSEIRVAKEGRNPNSEPLRKAVFGPRLSDFFRASVPRPSDFDYKAILFTL